MNNNVAKCPECGSKNVVKIVYGTPTSGMIEAANEGLIELGDTDCLDYNPKFKCKDCEAAWGGMEIGYIRYNDLRSINIAIDTYDRNNKTLFKILIDFDDRRIVWFKDDSKSKKNIKYLNHYNIKNIIAMLKQLNLLNWAQYYEHKDKLNNVSWEINIISKYGFCNKKGRNAYPNHWDNLINLIYNLTEDHILKTFLSDRIE